MSLPRLKWRWPAATRGLVLAMLGGLVVWCSGCAPAPPPGIEAVRPAPLPTVVPSTPTPAPAISRPSPPTTMPSTANLLLAEARGWAFRARTVACLATGSAFAMAGHIVTNRHVASGSVQLQFSTWDGTDFQAKVQAISTGPDLAILNGRTVPEGTTEASPASSDPAPGTPVWAVGYPEGGQLSALAGTVIGYIAGASIGASGQVMEITNHIEPGNSGSALLDGAGDVVGVTFAKDIKTRDGLAIPVSELQHFLARPGTALGRACQ